jgi:hypothetical protein
MDADTGHHLTRIL